MADFLCDDAGRLRIRAAEQAFKLLPGEEIRTRWWSPVLKGDRLRAGHLALDAGTVSRVPAAGCRRCFLVRRSSYYFDTCTAPIHVAEVLSTGTGRRHGWTIGGWTWAGIHAIGRLAEDGHLEVDTRRFPKACRSATHPAQRREDDLVRARTGPCRRGWPNTIEWILGGAGAALNLGNPEAWAWLVNHVDKLLVEQHRSVSSGLQYRPSPGGARRRRPTGRA